LIKNEFLCVEGPFKESYQNNSDQT
jgi:hypothetical protein